MDSRRKRAASGQLAVSGKQCDNKKTRAIQNFTHRERVRKGTDKVLQGREVGTKAPTVNPVVAKFQTTVENIMVAPIRCPNKKQEARQQLRNVGRGFQDTLGNVTGTVGKAVNGVTGAVGNAVASLQRTAGGRA